MKMRRGEKKGATKDSPSSSSSASLSKLPTPNAPSRNWSKWSGTRYTPNCMLPYVPATKYVTRWLLYCGGAVSAGM